MEQTRISPRALRSLLLTSWLLLPPGMCEVFNLPIWYRNTYALVQAQAGTPSNPYLLRFDTGSATTWMVDANCGTQCINYSGYPRGSYNLSASSTGSELGTYAVIDYLGGVTAGPGVRDIFSLTSLENHELEWNQTFMAADRSSWNWNPGEGFLGLAFSSIADAGTKTVVETMMQAGLLDQPRFSLYLGKEFENTGNNGDGPGEGVLTLGASLEEKYAVDGSLVWIDLQRSGGTYQLWRTNMASMVVATNNCSPKKRADVTHTFSNSWAIFDTGAGLNSVPKRYIEEIYQSFGMNFTNILNGGHKPLCTEFNSSWSITFQFGDASAPVPITLRGDQLARPGFAGSDIYCWPPFDYTDSDGLFLFGSSYLKQFYSVYDFGATDYTAYKPRIGFATLKDEWKP